MTATTHVVYTIEEETKMEIRNFINEGWKDVQKDDLYDLDEAFDELESIYNN